MNALQFIQNDVGSQILHTRFMLKTGFYIFAPTCTEHL